MQNPYFPPRNHSIKSQILSSTCKAFENLASKLKLQKYLKTDLCFTGLLFYKRFLPYCLFATQCGQKLYEVALAFLAVG